MAITNKINLRLYIGHIERLVIAAIYEGLTQNKNAFWLGFGEFSRVKPSPLLRLL